MPALLDVPTRARLLEDEPEPAQEVGVGGAVARVGVVVDLLGEVQGAHRVQRRRPVVGEAHGDVGVDRLRQEGIPRPHRLGRLEEVRAGGAHLVVVGDHVGPPPLVPRDAGLGLGVHQGEPVPVEVEPVVVGPAAGPHLVVLPVQGVGHHGLGPVHVGPPGVPVPAVGVQVGLHEEDAVGQVALHLAGARHQPVRGEHGGLRRGGLVAVDAVAQVHDHGHVGRGGGIAVGGGGGQVRGPDVLEAAQVLRRADREHGHGPMLVRHPDLLVGGPVREAGQLLHVRHDAVVAGVVGADGVAQELLGARDPVQEADAVGEVVVEPGGGGGALGLQELLTRGGRGREGPGEEDGQGQGRQEEPEGTGEGRTTAGERTEAGRHDATRGWGKRLGGRHSQPVGRLRVPGQARRGTGPGPQRSRRRPREGIGAAVRRCSMRPVQPTPAGLPGGRRRPGGCGSPPGGTRPRPGGVPGGRPRGGPACPARP